MCSNSHTHTHNVSHMQFVPHPSITTHILSTLYIYTHIYTYTYIHTCIYTHHVTCNVCLFPCCSSPHTHGPRTRTIYGHTRPTNTNDILIYIHITLHAMSASSPAALLLTHMTHKHERCTNTHDPRTQMIYEHI